MKTKLLLTLSFFTLLSHAQSISSYYGNNSATPTDGITFRNYFLVNSATPLDQSATGQGIVWNFDQISQDGTSLYQNSTPTAAELSDYPNATRVVNNFGGADNSTLNAKVFLNESANGIFLIGAESADLILNYNDNYAKIGVLPMAYGYSSIDTSSGSFVYGDYSGSFSGTINTTVDATGTLFTNFNFNADPIPVVRFKTVQQLALSYGFFGVVGNVTQTTYEYFYLSDLYANFPVFKSTTTHLVSSLLSIDDTNTTLEQSQFVFLGNAEFSGQALLTTVSPNPVNDQLSIGVSSGNTLTAIEIYDMNGRKIIADQSGNTAIDVSALQRGTYLLKMQTTNGASVQKIIKN